MSLIDVDDLDEGVSVRTRVRDLFAEAAEATDALDPEILVCHRNGSELRVRVANSVPRRSAVLAMRTRHHAEALRGFGVSAWDAYDEAAVQLLCLADSEPVGAIRLVHNNIWHGEVADDFGPLHLGDAGPEFVTFSREIVAPACRGVGVSAVLALAACVHWSRYSAVDDLVVTSTAAAAPGLQGLGLRRMSSVVRIGPGRMPAVLMAGKVADAQHRTRERLSGKGWRLRTPGL
ncbi:hypothetical protein Lesp02_11950 [Lentzea sp. NBRC 105346]|uniref:hypothetical protein n=1 Tax=Lentzea sp. NBRC 105346 TaxID=3032205 RepID=UPI0024A559BB|nr:hypothetical protein [Lentzea sp. NBRC 105346]GLZ29005.1 hypothetical protein Lesp02_11950 [Lentzea sp. NBRC 105346]